MNHREQTDEEIMILYQAGSDSAFAELYRRHSGKIYGFLKNKLRNAERADEVFQEVFLKIHKSKHLYNSSLPALPWIFSVTKSVLLDRFRSETRIKNNETHDDSSIDNFQSPENSNTSENVQSLISRLPQEQQTAMQLRYVDEKTFDEIAESLNTSSVNARKLISRGVARLKVFSKKGADHE